MSRPASRAGQLTSSPSMSALNDVVRRSRALASSIASYGSQSSRSENSRGRRDSLTKEYKRRSISLDRASRFDDLIAQSGGVPRATKIRRWDGNCRTTTNWDCLRKDPELWFSNGDCLVHFCSEQESRRSPSLRLWLSDIQSSNCRPLLSRLVCRPHQESHPGNRSPEFPGQSDPQPSYDLYIPAPRGCRFDDATNYHLTTRNFFAWMFEKPLVGARLGESLCSLLERMNEWREDPEDNEDDFLAYIDAQGYTDFRDCPDHALAVLQWAEIYEHSDLWIDSFVHCTGMNDQLVSSQEFHNVSLTTKAMITRANLDMAVRLDRASAALADFCESDSIVNHRLNLSDSSLRHLESFRSWLQAYYVQKHGYWPPHAMKSKYGKIRPLPKHTLLTMYSDFRNLYQYLVDSTADPFLQPEVSRSVVDVLTSYDEQMKFVPLPHLIPHLPTTDFDTHELRRTKSSFSVFKSRKNKQNGKRVAVASALTRAANVGDLKIISSSVVREYALYERSFTLEENERITATEARMARWVLIYALLQTLISVTNAPDEVRDVEGIDYPLCAQTAGCPPWKMQGLTAKAVKRRSKSVGSIGKAVIESNDFLEYSNSRPTSMLLSRPRTAPYGSSAGPPPLDPPPAPSQASSPANQVRSRGGSFTAKPSRIPVPVTPKTPVATPPKPSRIPVPINRFVFEPISAFSSETDDCDSTDYPEDDSCDQSPLPTLPTRSSRRNITVPNLAPVRVPAMSSEADVLQSEDSSTPPPLSARSAKRRTMFLWQSTKTTSTPEVGDANETTDPKDEASVSPPMESPVSNYFEAPTMPVNNFSSPLNTDRSYLDDSRSETPSLESPSRGRATDRSSQDQSRQFSSSPGISFQSSENEDYTLASETTAPIFTSRSYGDRFDSLPDKYKNISPKNQSFSTRDIQNFPRPPTSRPGSKPGLPTSAPGSPSTLTPSNNYRDGQDGIIYQDGSIDDTTQSSDFWDEQRETTPRPLSNTMDRTAVVERPVSSASVREFMQEDNRERSNSNAQFLEPPASAPPTVTSFRDLPASLHAAGKSRRQRLFGIGEESLPQSSIATRRQGKGLVALVSKSIVSKPLIEPALPTTPLTPMSFMSFESSGQSSRTHSRAGTSFSSSRPVHVRPRSSELAQQFRQEIGWKKGAGWDEGVDNLLMGDGEVSN